MQALENGRFAVSTWSVHRMLGRVYPYSPESGASVTPREPYGAGSSSLTELPRQLAARGIGRLEICSFHLASLEKAYLAELRSRMTEAGVLFQTMLVEDGDLSHPQTAERDAGWMAQWIGIAAVLGARNMRVIAGKQPPTEENLERAARHLRWLADAAEGSGVRIVVENWFDLLPGPQQVNRLLDTLSGTVGLNGDFGNWAVPAKYDGLAEIMGRAELCHAKAHYGAAGLDGADYRRCVDISEKAGYAGPYTLIYDSAHFADEWDGILLQKRFIEKILISQASAAE